MDMNEDQELLSRKTQIQDLAGYLVKITQKLGDDIDSFVRSFKQFGKTFVYDQMVIIRLILL
jgi:hypothetical protein